MRILTSLSILAAAALAAPAATIDWNEIQYWAGEGTNRAALVVQFNTPDQANPGAIVWGYRWNDGATPTGEDIVRAVAASSPDLAVLTQFTGDMGNTLCAFGYAEKIDGLLSKIEYDLTSAMSHAYPNEGSNISFGYLEPNTTMGQTSAPGQDAGNMVYDAIAAAEDTHVIDHPLNAEAFGYACYDYDWWLLHRDAADTQLYWNAGWYTGYWSYWTGGADMESLSYSGLGMTSVELEDGMVTAWKFNSFATRAAEPWLEPNYKHFMASSAVASIEADATCGKEYYRLDGTRVSGTLPAGIYLEKQGTTVRKILIK